MQKIRSRSTLNFDLTQKEGNKKDTPAVALVAVDIKSGSKHKIPYSESFGLDCAINPEPYVSRAKLFQVRRRRRMTSLDFV